MTLPAIEQRPTRALADNLLIKRERERERERKGKGWSANSAGDLDSITGRVIPKSQKLVLDASLFTIIIKRYGSRVNGAIQGKDNAHSYTSV